MDIKEFIDNAHKQAINSGFYDCEKCEGKGFIILRRNKSLIQKKCQLCNSTGKQQNKNIGEILMLIVSELGEALEAHRKNNTYDNIEYPEDITKKLLNCFEIEIADVFIRLSDMCGYLNIDIEKFINIKMDYNKTRPYKHGKEY
jgi:NTP pyrophosphatase (non-canonical NTP hydrolase)